MCAKLMAEVEHEDEAQVPPKRKKRGFYKSYKYDDTKKVPRQTIHGWKKKKGRESSRGDSSDTNMELDVRESSLSSDEADSSSSTLRTAHTEQLHEAQIEGTNR